ncbi:hypothetical protein SD457_10800 [Coprobacillaceae bacterium CR2/5/TPMF4]|nr:hypothetical protein SD457_10800 [Coprobacillaceae bacterium CR2/5/TPMF4]
MAQSEYLILNVEMTKQTVNVGENFIIRVSVSTWDFYLKITRGNHFTTIMRNGVI